MTKSILFAQGPEALQREGLKEIPEAWEDGLRTQPQPGNFEWWYFDAHFEDGSTAVIVFFTKSILDRASRLKPGVSIAITRPDGHKLNGIDMVEPAEFSSSKERCYVRAGKSFVRGDLCSYELQARAGDMSVHLNLQGQVPAWRPGTGKNYYDENLSRYFAWLPAIPYGSVSGQILYDGKMRQVKGNCYHDHNWGNVGLNEVLSYWYWGRAHVGEYSLIFAEMNGTARYGNQKVPVFMLARGNQILTGDGEPLKVLEGEFVAHEGGRSYPEGLDLLWEKGAERIRLTLREPKLIEAFSLLEMLPTWQQFVGRILANPYYFRFQSSLDLHIDLDGLTDHQQGQALYEFMLLR